MAELVDAPGSGPGEAIHRSSSLLPGNNYRQEYRIIIRVPKTKRETR